MNDKDSRAPNPEKLSGDEASSNATTHGEAPANGSETPEPDLDLGALGGKLRELYGSWVDEPIPERFSKLLDELDEEKPDNT